ncbi:Uracil phosphoribosyltransferase / Pyrimidine operon regulatory protein pyrR [Lactobacillus helveticus H10]|nr:Uracil phosphoribosyltransferase / Pyrimidine operon regulatory protein pyrR [Lactobacillus helveticus H10]
MMTFKVSPVRLRRKSALTRIFCASNNRKTIFDSVFRWSFSFGHLERIYMAKEIIDAIGMKRALMRMTYEIVERNKGTENLVLVGIKTRGLYLAQRIAANLKKLEDVEITVGAIDVSQYRDDLPESKKEKMIHDQQLDFDITDKNVVLVDDVLFTGRTIRAALDALMDQGRPAKINLAVLVDRGHRELPIRPDFIGKNIPAAMNEEVKVSMTEVDDKDSIELINK